MVSTYDNYLPGDVCLYKLFTAATPFAIGLFDRHRSAVSLLQFPKLYKLSQASANFNSRVNKQGTYVILFLYLNV